MAHHQQEGEHSFLALSRDERLAARVEDPGLGLRRGRRWGGRRRPRRRRRRPARRGGDGRRLLPLGGRCARGPWFPETRASWEPSALESDEADATGGGSCGAAAATVTGVAGASRELEGTAAAPRTQRRPPPRTRIASVQREEGRASDHRNPHHAHDGDREGLPGFAPPPCVSLHPRIRPAGDRREAPARPCEPARTSAPHPARARSRCAPASGRARGGAKGASAAARMREDDRRPASVRDLLRGIG